MTKALIVDDEAKARESLKILLSEFCENVEVIGLAGTVDEAIALVDSGEPDIVFLDIQMQRETGFDLLNRLKQIDFEVIFTTAHSEYAITAIKFSAIDYLLKPIDVAELKSALKKAEQKLKQKDLADKVDVLFQNMRSEGFEDFKMALPSSEGLHFIAVKDILYCTASGNYTEFFMKNNSKILVSKTLKEFETLLSNHPFFRIHHSYLVNLKEITKYVRGDGGYVVMSNGQSLDVSKRKKESFLERIGLG